MDSYTRGVVSSLDFDNGAYFTDLPETCSVVMSQSDLGGTFIVTSSSDASTTTSGSTSSRFRVARTASGTSDTASATSTLDSEDARYVGKLRLGGGTIAGIVIGGVAGGALFIGLAVYVFILQRRISKDKKKAEGGDDDEAENGSMLDGDAKGTDASEGIAEADGDGAVVEADGDAAAMAELPSKDGAPPRELEGDNSPATELESGVSPASMYQTDSKLPLYGQGGHGRNGAVELP